MPLRTTPPMASRRTAWPRESDALQLPLPLPPPLPPSLLLMLLPLAAALDASEFANPESASSSAALNGAYKCPVFCHPQRESYYSDRGVHKYDAKAYGISSPSLCRDHCLKQNYTVVWGDMARYGNESWWSCECYDECGSDTKYGGSDGNPIISFGIQNCLNLSLHNPHFVGAHGTRFEFHGELGKAYCLITDKDFQINGVFKGYDASSVAGTSLGRTLPRGVRSWVREVGLIWLDSSGARHTLLLLPKDGKANSDTGTYLQAVFVDRESVPVPVTPGPMYNDWGVHLSFEGEKETAFGRSDVLKLVTESLEVSVVLCAASPLFQLEGDSFIHFNLNIKELKASQEVHGVLGQTFRQTTLQSTKALKYSIASNLLGEPVDANGPSGSGFLDGDRTDYETPGILSHKCKFSQLKYDGN